MIVSYILIYIESNLSLTPMNIESNLSYMPVYIELKKFFIKFCIKRYYKHNFFTSNEEPFVTFNVIDSMPREWPPQRLRGIMGLDVGLYVLNKYGVFPDSMKTGII